ncbi:MAG: hypothetical protein NTX39_12525 [Opitutae bacterium]|nr:hypothetical protein [Opitutae bacterium]
MQLSLSVLSDLTAAPGDALPGLSATTVPPAPEESFAELLPHAEGEAATEEKPETDPAALEAAALLAAASWLNPGLPPGPISSWSWGRAPVSSSGPTSDELSPNPAPAALVADPLLAIAASAPDLTPPLNPLTNTLREVAADGPGFAVLAPTFAENLAAKREALRGEKIAAELERTNAPADELTNSDKKDFLITDLKSVNSASASVGTRVAKEMAPMIFTLTNRTKTAAAELAVGAFTPSLPSTSAFTTSVDVPAPVATVSETLAAVATAIESLEQRASGAASRVDLQFQVGDDKLGVRVEWREGTLHTFFRTDSPELRAALAHEWQSALPPVVSRELNVAPPVFGATADRPADFSSLNSGHPQDRPAPTLARAAALKRSGSAAPVVVAAASVSPATHSLSLLHAFA